EHDDREDAREDRADAAPDPARMTHVVHRRCHDLSPPSWLNALHRTRVHGGRTVVHPRTGAERRSAVDVAPIRSPRPGGYRISDATFSASLRSLPKPQPASLACDSWPLSSGSKKAPKSTLISWTLASVRSGFRSTSNVNGKLSVA